ncbi:MAG: hypothetical protein IKZ60_08090, partial [Bacteroidales bacterium]|nr:hypothetical protein [Bacteroidales bacterium]
LPLAGGGRSFGIGQSPAPGKVVADTLLSHGIRVSDGVIYGGPSGVRINLACPEATMKEGLRRIAEGLEIIL